jgi:rare lipoprotein A
MAMAYRPAYALVANADKRVIVKINDVGLLEPGRVIDFNEQTMRYLIRLCSTG